MHDSSRNFACPDFSDALIAAKEAGEIELAGKTVGRAFQRSADTGEEIIRGGWDQRLKELRCVLFSPFARVFLEWLTCGTDFMVVRRPKASDVDGDGDIDKDDVIADAIAVTTNLGEQLGEFHKTRAGRGYTSADGARINQLIGAATDRLHRMGAAVVRLTLKSGSDSRPRGD